MGVCVGACVCMCGWGHDGFDGAFVVHPEFLRERVGLFRDDEGAAFRLDGRGCVCVCEWGGVLWDEGLDAVDGEPVEEEAGFAGDLWVWVWV